jgi:hypothetical protein
MFKVMYNGIPWESYDIEEVADQVAHEMGEVFGGNWTVLTV